jgi:hypothetical protein
MGSLGVTLQVKDGSALTVVTDALARFAFAPRDPFVYPRDREGWALCHHGRRIACDECVAEEESAFAIKPTGV